MYPLTGTDTLVFMSVVHSHWILKLNDLKRRGGCPLSVAPSLQQINIDRAVVGFDGRLIAVKRNNWPPWLLLEEERFWSRLIRRRSYSSVVVENKHFLARAQILRSSRYIMDCTLVASILTGDRALHMSCEVDQYAAS